MLSNDLATHDINDNPLTHDIGDDDPAARAGFASDDMDARTAAPGLPHAYTGPVIGLQHEYIGITGDRLNIGVSNDDWFIHSGSGDDAITAHGGTNVLDGGTGSNFLTGGTGRDTFFVDDRSATADIWSTVVNFHAGDDATVWGLTPQDFDIAWSNNEGATGFTGLTLHATAAGKPTASLTLAGFTTDDMSNGRLSVTFGHDAASGSSFMNVHSNS
jgi:Ca2+-binding RTX toxin-like protein